MCTPESISGCQRSGCGTPNSASISGKIDGQRIGLAQHLEIAAAAPACSSARCVSCQTRSGTSASSSPRAAISRISAIVSGATRKPSGAKRAAKRATRSTRTGSSTNAGDTWRSQRSLQIALAVERIDELRRSVGSLAIALIVRSRRSRSCSSVTSGENRRLEAAIAGTGLAFGARERVFLARLRMQEDGKVLADGLVAQRGQFLGGCAHDDPVALAHRQAEQFVAYRAADEVGFHDQSVTDAYRSAGQRHGLTTYAVVSMLNSRLLTANRRRCSLILPLSGCYLHAGGERADGDRLHSASRSRRCSRIRARRQSLRKRLEYVSAARDFASRELALPDNESYRSYADVGRPYVVWNVFATDEFSVEPRRWCFPIAGCVVYRGYFNEEDAQHYARRLRLRGDDTAVGGVAAYSTLGHFKDPVLNTMMGWSDAQLAGRCSTSSRTRSLYVPGDSEFNEAFATVVEEAGLERWLMSRGRAEELAAWRTQRARSAEFIALLLQARDRLRALYASGVPVEEMRERKQYQFGQLKLEYTELKRRWNGYRGYDHWFDRTLNNAHLVSAATYYGCVPGLQRLLEQGGGDLPRFYAEIRRLADADKQARADAVCSAAAPAS